MELYEGIEVNAKLPSRLFRHVIHQNTFACIKRTFCGALAWMLSMVLFLLCQLVNFPSKCRCRGKRERINFDVQGTEGGESKTEAIMLFIYLFFYNFQD